MAYASFWERLTADAVLPALVRETLSLGADAVYAGRQRRAVAAPVEVLLERGERANVGDGGADVGTVHVVEARIRRHGLAGRDRSGAAATEAVEALAEALVERLDGLRPWPVALPELVAVEAAVTERDVAEDDPQVVEAVVQIRLVTRGTGAQVVGAGAGEFGGAM